MKGQSFSFDAIIAAIIFIVAIFSFFNFLLFFQSAIDYRKDTMDKDMIRISALLMSDDPDYGIMDSVTANRIIAEGDDMDGRIFAVKGTSPYGLCVQITDPVSGAASYHVPDCFEDMQGSSSQERMSRIVQSQGGRTVSMTISLYDKMGG